jgi:hypothetical protein
MRRMLQGFGERADMSAGTPNGLSSVSTLSGNFSIPRRPTQGETQLKAAGISATLPVVRQPCRYFGISAGRSAQSDDVIGTQSTARHRLSPRSYFGGQA